MPLDVAVSAQEALQGSETGTRELLLAPMVKRLLLLLTSGVMVRSGLPTLSGLDSFTRSSSLKETSEGSGVKQPWRQSNTLATLSLSLLYSLLSPRIFPLMQLCPRRLKHITSCVPLHQYGSEIPNCSYTNTNCS